MERIHPDDKERIQGVWDLARNDPEALTGYGAQEDYRIVRPDGEVRQVSLTPRPPSALSGAIVTDDGKVPPFAAARLAIDPVAADPEVVLTPWGAPNPNFGRPFVASACPARNVSSLRKSFVPIAIASAGNPSSCAPIATQEFGVAVKERASGASGAPVVLVRFVSVIE